MHLIVGPKVIEKFNDMSIHCGHRLEMKTKISGVPKPDVFWFKNDTPLKEEKRFSLIEEGENYKLILESVKEEDVGMYSVKATNPAGSVAVSAQVSVLQLPMIQTELSDVDVIEGEVATFKVPIVAIPAPTISWLKGAEELKTGGNLKISFDDNFATLEIRKTVLKDSDKYTIVVRNSVGEVRSSANLNILSIPTMTELSDQKVIVGQSLHLLSKITGVPAPTVTWLQNDAKMEEGERTSINEKDGQLSLMKKAVTITDEGRYSLIVENKAGKVEKISNVVVLVPPSFKEPIVDQTLLENEDLQFQVIVLGKPAPNIQWMKDDKELKADKRTKIIKDADVGSVQLKKVETSDSGIYKCIAKNEAGEITIEAMVTINSKPQVVKKLKDCVINDGETLILETQFKAFPEPEIMWFKDDVPLPPENSKIHESIHHYTIKGIKVAESGVYSAIAKNLVGECKTSAKLKVIQAPYFVKALTDVTMVEKEPMKLEAEIHGFPDPEIQWMKDGKLLSTKKSGNEKISCKKEGNLHFLHMAKVSFDDQGVYSLIAKNQAGEVTCQATIVVQGMSNS